MKLTAFILNLISTILIPVLVFYLLKVNLNPYNLTDYFFVTLIALLPLLYLIPVDTFSFLYFKKEKDIQIIIIIISFIFVNTISGVLLIISKILDNKKRIK